MAASGRDCRGPAGRRSGAAGRTAAVSLVLVALLGAACSSDDLAAVPTSGSTAPVASTTSVARPPRTVAPSRPRASEPSPATSPTSSTLPFVHVDEPTARIGDLSDIEICTVADADDELELHPGQFEPRTFPPDAQMKGAARIAGRPFTSVRGDADLVIADVPPADRHPRSMVMGYLDRETGSFKRRVGLDRCPVMGSLSDGTTLWVVGQLAQGGMSEKYVLVELDLRTGTRTWARQIAEPPRWWQVVGARLELALGGDRDAIREPFDTIPFGIDTVETGTGRLVGSVDVQSVRPDDVMASDGSLWIRASRADLGGGPYQEIDRATGATIRTAELPPRTSSVIHGGAIWSTNPDGVLERRPLDTLEAGVVDYGSGPIPGSQLFAGSSGVWLLSVSGPTRTTVTLTRIDPATATDRGSFSYESYSAVQDRSGASRAVLPTISVDAYGVHTDEWTTRWDGNGDPPPAGRAVFEVVIP